MKIYWELSKPRITILVVVTAWIGWGLAGGGDGLRLAAVLAGVALCASATGTLNQLLELDKDALMRRTASRPLTSGRATPAQALAFGSLCAAAGAALLAWQGGVLACGLGWLTILGYLFLYTPLKALTPHSTWVGALAGAAPPLIGWAAARGTLEPLAWMLFAIQFLWQIPHFLALFWLYREDYARAGFKVMAVVDPAGRATALQIALHSFALLLASVLPAVSGLAGPGYGLFALALGTGFLLVGLRASWTLEAVDARRLFTASLAYLPAILGVLVLARGR